MIIFGMDVARIPFDNAASVHMIASRRSSPGLQLKKGA
jgi:hypothetical protein